MRPRRPRRRSRPRTPTRSGWYAKWHDGPYRFTRLVGNDHARVVEWQTRRTQNPLLARAWGFKSPLGYSSSSSCPVVRRARHGTVRTLRGHMNVPSSRARDDFRADRDIARRAYAARWTRWIRCTRRGRRWRRRRVASFAHGIHSFVREFPLTWKNRRDLFDFGSERERTILETNGRLADRRSNGSLKSGLTRPTPRNGEPAPATSVATLPLLHR
jgi:hypothetical protein